MEIISPGQTLTTMRAKCREFRSRGVDVVWLIRPVRRTVEVFDGDLDGELLTGEAVLESSHIPGFEVALDELFGAVDR